MNTGIDAAMASACDHLWLLNNDLTVAPNAIAQLAAFSQLNPHYLCVGATIINAASQQTETVGGYRYWPCLSLALPIQAKVDPRLAAAPTNAPDYLSGAALWLSASALWLSGGLPATDFLYFEELRLTRLLGGKQALGVCAEAQVLHESGVSASLLPNSEKTYYATLAALRYTQEFYPYCIASVIVSRLLVAALRSLRRRRLADVIQAFRALKTFLQDRRIYVTGQVDRSDGNA